jgi:hypothetical protein
MRVKIVLVIISLVLFGCKTSQTSTTKSLSTATDTVRIKEVIYVKDSSHTTAPVNTSIELPSPCDSLGRLVAYYQRVKVGNNTITVDTRSGGLVINANDSGSNNRQLSQFISKDSGIASTRNNHLIESNQKVIIKTIWPWWLIAYAILITLVAGVMSYAFFNLIFIKR